MAHFEWCPLQVMGVEKPYIFMILPIMLEWQMIVVIEFQICILATLGRVVGCSIFFYLIDNTIVAGSDKKNNASWWGCWKDSFGSACFSLWVAVTVYALFP